MKERVKVQKVDVEFIWVIHIAIAGLHNNTTDKNLYLVTLIEDKKDSEL